MDLNLASNWPWLAGGAAAVAGGWGFVRSTLEWLSTLLIGEIAIQGNTVPVDWFIWNQCSRIPMGIITVQWETINRNGSKREYAAYEKVGYSPLITFYGLIPLKITWSEGKGGGGSNMRISYIKGTIKPYKFINDIRKAFENKPVKGRFRVGYRCGPIQNSNGPHGEAPRPLSGQSDADITLWSKTITHTQEELISSSDVPGIEDLSLDPEIADAVKEVQQWLGLKEWYRSKGIPWRRGWLLTGKPGTGKSTLVKSLAKTLDMPLIYFDLSTFLNGSFMETWKEQSALTPFIALFEDIDAVFDKRENLNKTINGGLTFDCFLNAIAGADTTDGIFTVITTNDITKIDPALAVFDEHGGTSRPGRIDRILDLKALSTASRLKIAQRILKDHSQATITDVVTHSMDFTAAQFTEVCVRKALKEKWNK